jgi:hypothetical protein
MKPGDKYTIAGVFVKRPWYVCMWYRWRGKVLPLHVFTVIEDYFSDADTAARREFARRAGKA